MKYRKILVPIDFSEGSLNAFDVALQQFSGPNCTLVLLHVIEPVQSDVTFGVNLGAEKIETLQHQLRTLGNSHRERWQEVETRIEVGKPADVILIAATQENFDLTIVGSNSTTKGFGLWLGKNAYALARALPCNVMIIKPSRSKI